MARPEDLVMYTEKALVFFPEGTFVSPNDTATHGRISRSAADPEKISLVPLTEKGKRVKRSRDRTVGDVYDYANYSAGEARDITIFRVDQELDEKLQEREWFIGQTKLAAKEALARLFGLAVLGGITASGVELAENGYLVAGGLTAAIFGFATFMYVLINAID